MIMDFILDVIVLREQLKKMDINEVYFEWGGEKISQEPRKYEYNNLLKFEELTDKYYDKIISDYNDEEYIILTLDSQILLKLYDEINQNKDVKRNELILFLNKLFSEFNSFYVVLFRDEECIDEKYVISDKEEFTDLFCNALNKFTPRGIVVLKPEFYT